MPAIETSRYALKEHEMPDRLSLSAKLYLIVGSSITALATVCITVALGIARLAGEMQGVLDAAKRCKGMARQIRGAAGRSTNGSRVSTALWRKLTRPSG
jgi:hypothetical protein